MGLVAVGTGTILSFSRLFMHWRKRGEVPSLGSHALNKGWPNRVLRRTKQKGGFACVLVGQGQRADAVACLRAKLNRKEVSENNWPVSRSAPAASRQPHIKAGWRGEAGYAGCGRKTSTLPRLRRPAGAGTVPRCPLYPPGARPSLPGRRSRLSTPLTGYHDPLWFHPSVPHN